MLWRNSRHAGQDVLIAIRKLILLHPADAASFSVQGGDIGQSLLSLGLLIIVAKLAEGVFRRLHLISILAYAIAGILLGPLLQMLTGWSVQPTGHIDLLLTLGIFIFFFLIGLDEMISPVSWRPCGAHYFLAAIVSVLFSLGVSVLVTSGTVVDLGFTLTFAEALALAGILHEQPGDRGQGSGR